LNKLTKKLELDYQRSTLQTRYNADVGIHNIRPRYKWVA